MKEESKGWGFPLILFMCVVAVIVYKLVLPNILYHKYREGYLRGQTDAYGRNWKNVYQDSTSDGANIWKEWKLKPNIKGDEIE